MAQNNNLNKQEESINIRETFFYYLNYWKWIVVSVIVCLSFASLYLLKTNNLYAIKTSILIKQGDSNGGSSSVSESDVLKELGLPTEQTNIDNETQVFQSADLIKNTIVATDYSVSYSVKEKLKKEKLFPAPIKLSLRKISLDTISQPIEFQLKKETNGYTLSTTYANADYKRSFSNFPVQIAFPFGEVRIDNTSQSIPDELYINVNNTENMAVAMSNAIKITPTSKNSDVLEISISSDNVKKGEEFLKKLVDIYNLQAVQDKNQISYNTALFIEDRLKSLAGELSNVEKNVEEFKTKNRITDLSSQANLFMNMSSDNETKANEVETQLNIIKYVEDYLTNIKNKNHLIPNLGITDPGLSALINNYNELYLNKERIQAASTPNNPVVENMTKQLYNMKSGIKNNILNVKKSLVITLSNLNNKNALTTGKIEQIPHIERKFTEINRQEQVKENLYEFLLQKREETNLSLAATAPKARIISNPRASGGPISPNKNIILLAALLLGLAIPIGAIYVKDMLQISIKNIDDLETQSKAPVIGEIPLNKTEKQVIVEANDTSSITEFFRSLRNNLTFILSEPDKKVITVTSTISGEGKTFVCLNLACAFALIEKKVLLVGLDIRNPSLAKYTNMMDKSKGITSYLAQGGGNVDEYIATTPFNPNLDVFFAGIIPPNPNELLNKKALDELFVELRNRYDYIIIDTAPVGLISDTFLINRVSDITLYITRENITSKESISFVNELYENNKLANIYVVLNASDIEKKRYNKYYKHGYYYYYGYHRNTKNKRKYSFSSIKDILAKPQN